MQKKENKHCKDKAENLATPQAISSSSGSIAAVSVSTPLTNITQMCMAHLWDPCSKKHPFCAHARDRSCFKLYGPVLLPNARSIHHLVRQESEHSCTQVCTHSSEFENHPPANTVGPAREMSLLRGTTCVHCRSHCQAGHLLGCKQLWRQCRRGTHSCLNSHSLPMSSALSWFAGSHTPQRTCSSHTSAGLRRMQCASPPCCRSAGWV